MNTKSTTLASIVFLIMFATSCSSYVGQTVDIGNPNVCTIYSPQHPCVIGDKDIRIKIEISDSTETGTYSADGAVDLLGKANFNQVTSARINILLINDNVVVDSVPISIVGGEPGATMKFQRAFKADKKFNAITAGYSFRIQG